MRTVNVLSLTRVSDADKTRIEAVDPAVRVTSAAGWFDGELRETWPAFTAARYLPPESKGIGTREERDRLLADADVVIGGWPYPRDLRARAPRLKWFHQRPAGASNLLGSDLWGSGVTVPNSAKPKPSLSAASGTSAFLSNPAASPTGLGNRSPKR